MASVEDTEVIYLGYVLPVNLGTDLTRLDNWLCCAEAFSLVRPHFFFFFAYVSLTWGDIAPTPKSLRPILKNILLMCFPRSFIVSGFTFISF